MNTVLRPSTASRFSNRTSSAQNLGQGRCRFVEKENRRSVMSSMATEARFRSRQRVARRSCRPGQSEKVSHNPVDG